MSRHYIIVQPQGGLCNRMRTIAGAYKLAQALKKRLVVLWVRNSELNERFHHLFAPMPFRVIDDHPGSIIQRWLWRIVSRTSYFTLIDDEKMLNSGWRDSSTLDWAKELVNNSLLICACHDIIKECDYSMFKPRDSIKNRCLVNINDKVIGIHIRRTDNEKSVSCSPTELFVQKMNEEIEAMEAVRFFLATDAPKEEALLKERYGNRIMINPKTSLDRNNPIAIQEALLDLYSLSRCRRIYGSYYSSFSDVAAVWGNTDKIVLKAYDL